MKKFLVYSLSFLIFVGAIFGGFIAFKKCCPKAYNLVKDSFIEIKEGFKDYFGEDKNSNSENNSNSSTNSDLNSSNSSTEDSSVKKTYQRTYYTISIRYDVPELQESFYLMDSYSNDIDASYVFNFDPTGYLNLDFYQNIKDNGYTFRKDKLTEVNVYLVEKNGESTITKDSRNLFLDDFTLDLNFDNSVNNVDLENFDSSIASGFSAKIEIEITGDNLKVTIIPLEIVYID
ncbi:MAG: hypothetical protein J6C97_01135 [Clostridia bacterium]|nr:hypothetical protein [Clostridia bacterium]